MPIAYGVIARKHKSQLRGRKRLEMFKPLQLVDLGQMEEKLSQHVTADLLASNTPQTKSKKKSVRINLLKSGIYTRLWEVF